MSTETMALVTPLGLQFHDAATGRVVGDGLRITHARHIAVSNRAGVWVLPDLTGPRFGAGDGEYWAHATPATFELTVTDTLGRYLPVRILAQAPFRGVMGELPLFAAPTRRALAGWGVVRAELREPSRRPAAFAMLDVTPQGGTLSTGMADAEGRVAVLVPYPRPLASTASPLVAIRRPLSAERWPLQIACRYGRLPADQPPVLDDALGQAAAALDLGPGPLELAYGQELVLRTPPNRPEVLVASPL